MVRTRNCLALPGWGRTLFLLTLLSLPMNWAGEKLQAQTGEGKLVGVVLGMSSSRQLWDYAVSSESSSGQTLGAYVEVPTPVSHLSIRAGLSYLNRATLVWDPQADPDRALETTVKSHYLNVPLHAKVGMDAGPVSAYLFGGPTVDILINTGCETNFCVVLGEETPMVFGVGVGSGLSFRLPNQMEAGLEVRLTEALADAYVGNLSGAHWRSVELLLRVGSWR